MPIPPYLSLKLIKQSPIIHSQIEEKIHLSIHIYYTSNKHHLLRNQRPCLNCWENFCRSNKSHSLSKFTFLNEALRVAASRRDGGKPSQTARKQSEQFSAEFCCITIERKSRIPEKMMTKIMTMSSLPQLSTVLARIWKMRYKLIRSLFHYKFNKCDKLYMFDVSLKLEISGRRL